jgi:nickel transport protein
MGHKNFWIVKKEELIPSKSNDENIESEDVEEDTNTEKVTSKAIDYKKLNRLFKKTIEQELAPIKRDLAELKEPKIDFRDILGGIGYIIGFMGIIMYFKSRN